VGCQKHGLLKKQGRGMGARFKKRYFVLRDGILCYYKGKSYAENQKPLGVIYLDEARIYELTDAKAKKFSFQIVTPRKNYTIAAKSATEMKEWMKELKLAKKRNLGIEVVARRDSLVGSPPLSSTTVPEPVEEISAVPRRGLLLSSARAKNN